MSNMSQYVSRAGQLAATGHAAEAENLLRWALTQSPMDTDANRGLGMLLLERGHSAEGAGHLRRAADSSPSRPDLWYELGMCLAVAERYHDAAAALERCIALAPQAPQVCELLGQVFLRMEEPGRALDVLARGLQIEPQNMVMAQAYVVALKGTGQVDEAARIAEYLATQSPDNPELLMLAAWQATYTQNGDPLRVRQWLERRGRFLAPGAAPVRFANPPDPDRRLRIGFLCQDIRSDSPIARFVAPALLNLDPSRFELVGYATQATLEHMTPRLLRTVAGGWIDVSRTDDVALLARIRADRIDVLVETAGNTFGNRQTVLAHRAAPVQVTCIGDPRTTGNPAIDYRIVDEVTDPRGTPGAERFCTEQLTRLPDCFLCYDPHEEAPHPRPSISRESATVTFGSFNIHDKIGPGVVELWSRILRSVEGSRILLKSSGLQSPALRERFHAMFLTHGIDPSRVELSPQIPNMRDHLRHYHLLDIALDPFPYNGTTTTCDALWMGVPVVTLAGSWHPARVGASLLTAVGLPELIASDPADYIRIATSLAADRPRLAALHSTLRERMTSSPLVDAPAYGRKLGDAYRSMWRSWCAASRTS